jgi:hypothetical protein
MLPRRTSPQQRVGRLAPKRLGIELGGLRQVDLAVVRQPAEVAQRGAAASPGLLDRDRGRGGLRRLPGGCVGVREHGCALLGR